ncbi:mechanosensitive ion channel family protein [Lutimonas zeaxanthinifaciens]|uniref:mechanosensitive ion channel family protein n=1 Tax=Lutimonas zeaxanthinifaciens TaxID=3060215 RepID=UPI00265D4318|nr:mechanosensitive ion channel domain-containing protein [Lutimonas sp. YSD2104]WKK65860.1 mechanosensitive ion channel [Lutimonas sp. YSD2104]
MIKLNSIQFILGLSLLFLSPQNLIAQDSSKASDTTAVGQEAIAIGDISEESEKLGQSYMKLKGTLEKSSKISDIDSIVEQAAPEILDLVDSVFLKREDVSLRDLKVRKVEWTNYKSILNQYQSTVKNRSEEISRIINDVYNDLKKWELTKKELEGRTESKDIADSFNTSIAALNEIMSLAQERLDSVFVTQKKITELVLIVDEEIANIEYAENQRRKDYFVFDSPPIWQKIEPVMVSDSVSAESLSSYGLIKKGISQNKKQFLDFFNLNTKIVVLQIVFLILLLAFLILANAKWKKNILTLRNPIEIQAKIILKNPLLTVLSVGVLVSAFFYDSMVPAYAEFHVMIVLLATVILLPKVTHKKFSIFLLLLFVVYLINTFEAFIGVKVNLIRWILIVDTILLFVSLFVGRKIVKSYPEKFTQIFRSFRIISALYMFLLIVALVANIIGMVALANYITKAVIVSLTFGVILYLAVKVFTSIFILIFKFRKSTNIQTITSMVNATHQRIRPLFNFIGFLAWMFFTLSSFEVYDFIVDWYGEVMATEWMVGEMTISLGGILAFVGIFIITLIIAKIAATLFQDEWMVNVLPRGVAPAISLVLRIVVIGLGLYAGLSAAGVDLSKLGFILGALGVGIGFGLQNVVLNFVSGLILAFERPINLGDTIEVDMEMGVVTNIGVRSSNIRAYSGAEVIIPNGDLISKKVVNWTLSNRNRRSKVPMKTSPDADPEKVIELFNKIAVDHPHTSKDPAPKTYFYGYGPDGNLNFALLYWTTFSDTLKTDSEIALTIFKTLKEEGIQAPAPVRRIISESPGGKE